jgi:hypothetical protein
MIEHRVGHPLSGAALAEQLAIEPQFARASRMLGQLAGILLLAAGGSDPGRHRTHLLVLKEQYAGACDAYRRLASPTHLGPTFAAVAGALRLIGTALQRIEHCAASPSAESQRALLLTELGKARRILQAGSVPGLGLAVVDLTTSCCVAHTAQHGTI